MSNKNKIILIYPGPVGVYLDGKLPSILSKQKVIQNIVNRALIRPVVLPLSTLTLIPYLAKEGFEVVHIDGRVEDSIKKLGEELDDNVLFVGISALTGNMIRYGLRYAKYIRAYNPDMTIVWGGVHVTLSPQQALETSEYVDIVVRGEGEHTIVELAKTLQSGGGLSGVLGISYKDHGGVHHNDHRPFMEFDKQLDLNYDILSLEKYDTKDTLLYQSERGCPHRCVFCDVVVVHRKKTRKKSAQNVLKDFEYLANKFKPGKIHLVDDCFFFDLNWASEIIEGLIKKNLNINWQASCRAQYFNRTDVNYWKRARESGLDELYVGVESGSQRMLDYMKKDCTIDDIYNAVDQTTEAGILFASNFMSGFPGESQEDVFKTIEMMDALNTRYGDKVLINTINLYAPCPGTPLHDEVVKAGFKPPETFEEWGSFLIGDRMHSYWHPLIDYISAASLCAKWGRRFDLKKSIKRLRRFNVPGIMLDLLGHNAHRKWKKRKFNYSYDLKAIRKLYGFFYDWRGL